MTKKLTSKTPSAPAVDREAAGSDLQAGELNALARYHEVQGQMFRRRSDDNYGWHHLPDGGAGLRKSAKIQVRYHAERRAHWLRVLKVKYPDSEAWADGPMRSHYGV